MPDPTETIGVPGTPIQDRIGHELRQALHRYRNVDAVLISPKLQQRLGKEQLVVEARLNTEFDHEPAQELPWDVPLVTAYHLANDEFQIVTDWHKAPWEGPVVEPCDDPGAWTRFKDIATRRGLRRALVQLWRDTVCYVKGHRLSRGPARTIRGPIDAELGVPGNQEVYCGRCHTPFATERHTDATDQDGGHDA